MVTRRSQPISGATNIYWLVCLFFSLELRSRLRRSLREGLASLPRACRPKGRRPSFLTRGETVLPRDCRPGVSPSFARVVRRYSPRKEPTKRTALRPSSSNWRSTSRPQNLRSVPADHARTHNEHPPRLVEHSLRSRPIAATGVTLLRRPLQDLGAHRSRKPTRESCEARRPLPRKEMQDGWKFFVVAPPLFSGWQPQSRRQGPQCSHYRGPRLKRLPP